MRAFHRFLFTSGSTLISNQMDNLRYPIGKFKQEGEITSDEVARWIDQIETLPQQVHAAIEGLSNEQLDTPYRLDGWTVRQVVHHIGDSHMNSLVRFKWALTEDEPEIKAYHQDRWAELADYRDVPIETALTFLEALHVRLVALLRSLDENGLKRRFVHPELGLVTLAWNIGLYAWHGRHHLAHITHLKAREGWE